MPQYSSPSSTYGDMYSGVPCFELKGPSVFLLIPKSHSLIQYSQLSRFKSPQTRIFSGLISKIETPFQLAYSIPKIILIAMKRAIGSLNGRVSQLKSPQLKRYLSKLPPATNSNSSIVVISFFDSVPLPTNSVLVVAPIYLTMCPGLSSNYMFISISLKAAVRACLALYCVLLLNSLTANPGRPMQLARETVAWPPKPIYSNIVMCSKFNGSSLI